MLRKSAVVFALLGTLGACGHTPEERLVSGAVIGAVAGAAVGVFSDPHLEDHDRGYERRRPPRRRGHHHDHHRKRWRDYSDRERWEYY